MQFVSIHNDVKHQTINFVGIFNNLAHFKSITMENQLDISPLRIQIIMIVVGLLFLATVVRLILKGKLREEYAIVWIVSTLVLIVFSFWRKGLDIVSATLGVYAPANLVFLGAILMILIYLLHLSLVVSKLQQQNKTLAQKIALMEAQEKKN